MVEATLQSARELAKEIWEVEDSGEAPEFARLTGRLANRLSNVGTVLIYCVLVAFGIVKFFELVPEHWLAGGEFLTNKWWFWVGLVLVLLAALRFGLDVTKKLKRWNVASLLGSLLLFDLVLKKGPPLFGLAGVSPVDWAFGAFGNSELGAMVQKVLGF